ncbi:MAG TPA: glycosyltransferase family 4 protein [Terriglobales bacterium]|jgi:glycosyltransferase involved in cell wall biosynthesis
MKVFDGVKIVARAEHKDSVDQRYRPVLGPGIEFFEVPYYLGPWQYARVWRRVRKAVRSAVADDDAVLCRVGSRLATDLLPMLWKTGRPYGLEVVGDPSEGFAPRAVKHPLRPVFRYLFTRSLKQECSRASAVSYVTEHALQQHYPARDAAISFSASDVELCDDSFVPLARVFITPLSGGFPHEHKLQTPDKGTRPRLVFVGSLAQMYKAPDVLIRAISLLHKKGFPVWLSIIGDGRHRRELEDLTRSLSVDSRVTFCGQLQAGAAVRKKLDEATLMVMPSRTEGLPRALVEAMARALPCVGTKVGGIPELLDAEDLVTPNDADGLADKLQEVLTDPERLTRMSASNLAKAQRYRIEVLEEKRRKFYRYLRNATEKRLANGKFSSDFSDAPPLVDEAFQ